MKLILIKDLSNLGKAGDIINVSNGYARNFLIPQKIAKIATNDLIKKVNEQKIKKNELNNKINNIVEKYIIPILKEHKFEFYVKTGNEQEVFSAVRENDILDKIYLFIKNSIDKEGIIKKDDIKISEKYKPIRELGNKKIKIKIKNHILSINLEVLGEK